jgi:hypothetical protein
MRGLAAGTPAYSPTYVAQIEGQQAAATAGSLFQNVASPVEGFTSGLLSGWGLWVGLGIIAVTLLNARE